MKVGSISFYNMNRANIAGVTPPNKTEEHARNPYMHDMNEAPLGAFDHYAVAFKSSPRLKCYDVNLHSLGIKNLPCPCCGKKMISVKDFNNLFNERNFPKKSKDVVQMLEPHMETMPETEKKVFQKVKEASEKHPEKSLQIILSILTPTALKELEASQIKTLNEINKACDGLPWNQSSQIKKLTSSARDVITAKSSENPFKRKKFILNIQKATSAFMPTKEVKRINELAKSLNTSSNDVNAFIVKYSRRNSDEIGKRFLSPMMATIEHIHAHSLFSDPAEADKMTNLILECQGCNGTKGDTPLTEQIKAHPEMKLNVQKHFDTFIDKILTEEIPPIYKPEYLIGLAKTLEEESQGMLKIDVSRLLSKDSSLTKVN